MHVIYNDTNVLCSFAFYLMECFIEPVHNHAAISVYDTDSRDMSFIHLNLTNTESLVSPNSHLQNFKVVRVQWPGICYDSHQG